ncbi:MAG: hypothetical protein M3137_02125 [Actinomycetota bacterium]|nr:hypothetical protein [Actinomycetota bacterium]
MTVLDGAWGALVPFIGPLFNYRSHGQDAWQWSTLHGVLYVAPGAVAVLCGLIILSRAGSHTRGSIGFAGLLVAACGAWFVVGPALWPTFGTGPVFTPAGSALDSFVNQVGYNLGVGVILAVLGGMALKALARDRPVAVDGGMVDDRPVATAAPVADRRPATRAASEDRRPVEPPREAYVEDRRPVAPREAEVASREAEVAPVATPVETRNAEDRRRRGPGEPPEGPVGARSLNRQDNRQEQPVEGGGGPLREGGDATRAEGGAPLRGGEPRRGGLRRLFSR